MQVPSHAHKHKTNSLAIFLALAYIRNSVWQVTEIELREAGRESGVELAMVRDRTQEEGGAG